MEIGDRVPSALDRAYQQYSIWCQQLRYPAANFDSWLRIERGLSCHSVVRLDSLAESRARLERMRATHSLTTA